MNALNYNGEVSIRYEEVSMEDADAFFSAVADGDYDKMVSMLDEGRANVNQTDSDGFSALINQCNVLGGIHCVDLSHIRDSSFVELLLWEL